MKMYASYEPWTSFYFNRINAQLKSIKYQFNIGQLNILNAYNSYSIFIVYTTHVQG